MLKTITDFKEVVLNSQDKNELYIAEVEIQELIGALHKRIRMADTQMDKSDAQAELGIATSLVGICRERQSEVGNWANKVNYNFRMAARSMLTKETYQKIWKQAQLTRTDTKEAKGELQKNRFDI
jgi:hypothetical protein